MTIAEYEAKHPPTNPDQVFIHGAEVQAVREGKIIVRYPVSEFRPEYLATLERRD